MPCYFPLRAYKARSKDPQKVCLTFRRQGSWRGEVVKLPCGQCIGCRLERARQWAVRCVHEASLYEKNCFLTLTYDDEHLPSDGSLRVEDFQLFMKRLRRSVEVRDGLGKVVYRPRIRYFHAGEYGEELGRPHYHAVVFNHDFADKKQFSVKAGNRLYTSAALSELWPLGHSVIGDVTFESAGYVARYALKKVTGVKADAHYGGLRPEYCTMSRRPGIGAGWLARFRGDVYPLDRVVVRGVPQRPPRFYDTQLGREDPALLAFLKIEREKNEKFVTDVVGGRKVVVSDSSDGRLLVKEEGKRALVKLLNRHSEVL